MSYTQNYTSGRHVRGDVSVSIVGQSVAIDVRAELHVSLSPQNARDLKRALDAALKSSRGPARR